MGDCHYVRYGTLWCSINGIWNRCNLRIALSRDVVVGCIRGEFMAVEEDGCLRGLVMRIIGV